MTLINNITLEIHVSFIKPCLYVDKCFHKRYDEDLYEAYMRVSGNNRDWSDSAVIKSHVNMSLDTIFVDRKL